MLTDCAVQLPHANSRRLSIPSFQVLSLQTAASVFGTIAALIKLSSMASRFIPDDIALSVFYFLAICVSVLGLLRAHSVLMATAVPKTVSAEMHQRRVRPMLFAYGIFASIFTLLCPALIAVSIWAHFQRDNVEQQQTTADGLYLSVAVHVTTFLLVGWSIFAFYFPPYILRPLEQAVAVEKALNERHTQHEQTQQAEKLSASPRPHNANVNSGPAVSASGLSGVYDRVRHLWRGGVTRLVPFLFAVGSSLCMPTNIRRLAVPYYAVLMLLFFALSIRNYAWNYRPPVHTSSVAPDPVHANGGRAKAHVHAAAAAETVVVSERVVN